MRTLLHVAALFVAAGCVDASTPPVWPLSPPQRGRAYAVGTSAPERPVSETELRAALAQPTTAESLRTSHPVAFAEGLGFRARLAQGMAAIQASPLALTPAELEALDARGFVISARGRASNFLGGYSDIFHADLPVYVTVDAILYAMHEGFGRALARVEGVVLAPALRRWLLAALPHLERALAQRPEQAADVGLYLGVAASVLTGAASPRADVRALAAQVLAGRGVARVMRYGEPRDVDFSQFAPRGHYADTPALQGYFRAVTWLGREGFALTSRRATGERVPARRQIADALALTDALTPALREDWAQLEAAVAGAMGEPDTLTLSHVPSLRARLGVDDVEALDDGALLAAIDAVRGRSPRVASGLLRATPGAPSPVPVAFSALAQRYSPDAATFTRVTFPSVGGGRVLRMMPDPLDVAFAALGNDHALSFLADPLARHPYAPELREARVLVDAHDRAYWEGSLAAGWLYALRALSPGETLADAASLPAVARTRDWATRLLQAQMASWAEYRHDTIASMAQSYTQIPLCSFPDGYVDPYPGFYARVARWAERGRGWAFALPAATTAESDEVAGVVRWFGLVASTAERLRRMAEHERTGVAFEPDDLAFLEGAMRRRRGCGSVSVSGGWYADLFFEERRHVMANPIVADVHTQPADEMGALVGRVLHVGTGLPRRMVVVAEGCTGPRAYVGFVSSYFEHTTQHFDRLTDARWAEDLWRVTTEDVWWASSIVTR